MTTNTAVVGFVRTRADADVAIAALLSAGFPTHEISTLVSQPHPTLSLDPIADTRAPETAAAGGVIGGALGLVAAVTALAIPGIGPLLAAGPLFVAMSGATAGALVGGVAGSLVGVGITESDATAFEERVRQGEILLSVQARTHEDRLRAERILYRLGAHDIEGASGTSI